MPMKLAELKKLIHQGEGLHVEFKRKIAEPLKVLREVVAFANKEGGYLLIGVDDNGNVPGLKYAQEEKFVLEKAIAAHCYPKVEYETQSIEVAPQRQVMIFTIKESLRKPVYLNVHPRKRKGKVFIRVADRSVQASKEVRKILKGKNNDFASAGFTYGENERAVIQQIAVKGKATLHSLAEATLLPLPIVSEVLVRLTIHNVLEVYPDNQGDWFAIKET